MKIGDKFHSELNGGIEVTVIDVINSELGNTIVQTLICVGDGLLLKYEVYYVHTVDGKKSMGEPKYIGCIDLIDNLKNM